METTKPNRSVRRTQNLLQSCLLELMQKKPIGQISVRELTDAADLNRGTFYLHYKDIYDLLEQMENDLLQEFIEIDRSHPPEAMGRQPLALLLDLFTFIADHEQFVTLILITNPDRQFVQKLEDVIRERCFRDWNILFSVPRSEKSELYTAYLISGCIGVIEHWLKEGLAQPPQELAEYVNAMIVQGIGCLAG